MGRWTLLLRPWPAHGSCHLLRPVCGWDSGYFDYLRPITLAALCEQCTVQRIVSAKSYKVAFWGLILSFIIMIPCALMPAFIGMYGNTIFHDTTNSVFFKVALDVLPPLAAALLIAAVVAAIMSTIDTLFVAFSTIILHNIYQG